MYIVTMDNILNINKGLLSHRRRREDMHVTYVDGEILHVTKNNFFETEQYTQAIILVYQPQNVNWVCFH